jgi:hypothetical protein
MLNVQIRILSAGRTASVDGKEWEAEDEGGKDWEAEVGQEVGVEPGGADEKGNDSGSATRGEVVCIRGGLVEFAE